MPREYWCSQAHPHSSISQPGWDLWVPPAWWLSTLSTELNRDPAAESHHLCSRCGTQAGVLLWPFQRAERSSPLTQWAVSWLSCHHCSWCRQCHAAAPSSTCPWTESPGEDLTRCCGAQRRGNEDGTFSWVLMKWMDNTHVDRRSGNRFEADIHLKVFL